MASIYTHVDVDVDIDEFLEVCTSSEIREVIEWLRDNAELINDDVVNDSNQSAKDEIFNEAVLKLVGNRFKLTVEQEEAIMNISKQII